GAADFGNGHSIVLIADSLAVLQAYARLDGKVSIDSLNKIFSASSNKRAVSAIIGSPEVEDDALENALDSLRRLFLGEDVKRTSYTPGPGGFGDITARNLCFENLIELTTNPSCLALGSRAQIIDVSAYLAG